MEVDCGRRSYQEMIVGVLTFNAINETLLYFGS